MSCYGWIQWDSEQELELEEKWQLLYDKGLEQHIKMADLPVEFEQKLQAEVQAGDSYLSGESRALQHTWPFSAVSVGGREE